ncbi:AAA family ATPase [Deinococcus sp. AJ005]|uniref:AAA family ATPase n=1 Tax=Deinococcus sp. AJ005 TaxID=2652443 RepID=UPI00125CC94F|nr:AAA family ATPase [Deinococcus sp. AJ005]QFP75015.1 AAA family ATPase [Deinococcus sp. AJ005]
MKLDSFALGRFKAFGMPQTVRFKPLTLLFGANSVGKSSLLQALLLVKHALETGEVDAYEVTAGGEHVNLGGIARMLHQHDAGQDITLTLCLQADPEVPAVGGWEARSVILELGVGIESDQTDSALASDSSSSVSQGVKSASITLDGIPLARFGVTGEVSERAPDRLAFVSNLNWEHPAVCGLLRSRTEALMRLMGDENVHPAQHDDLAHAVADAVARDLYIAQADLLRGIPGQAQQFISWDLAAHSLGAVPSPPADLRHLYALLPLIPGELPSHFQDYVLRQVAILSDEMLTRFLAPEFFEAVFAVEPSLFRLSYDNHPAMNAFVSAWQLYHADESADLRKLLDKTRDASRLIGYLRDDVLDIVLGAFQAAGAAMGKLGFLGPLRTVPDRHLGRRQAQDGRWLAGGGAAWDLLGQREDVRNQVNTWMADKLNMAYEVRNRKLFDETYVEQRVARSAYVASQVAAAIAEAASAKDASDIWKKLQPMLARAEAENQWNELHGQLSDLPAAEETHLFDRRHKVSVGARDVGLGVSQVLPVLVNAAAGNGRWLLVEQPELHLHPALQAELADVFVESIHERGHTFVLETHSEHLILRLLRRIRETTEDEGEPGLALTVDDVVVLYARPGEDGTVIETVEISPDGDFVHHWPAGFFADRSKELF